MLPVAFFYWDPNPIFFTLPVVGWPIVWYGALFALGFALGFFLFSATLVRFFQTLPLFASQDFTVLKKLATHLTDRFMIYMVLGTVLGARVGHYLFYESPSDYLDESILDFFKTWEGGLSSHGAALGIVAALWLFARRHRHEAGGSLTWLRLLDFVAAPTALAGVLIRCGNFINQEVLGTPTTLPWAVIFGHPLDHSVPEPRHPAQLYEALAYLVVFFVLWRLSLKEKWVRRKGFLIGLFLLLVFGARFVIEFWKEEQSRFFSANLTMGQLLSLPALLIGALLLYWSSRSRST